MPAAEGASRTVAHGKGWRLDKAVISDSTRPRILLIGDSILHNYFPAVDEALQGKAYLDAWFQGYCQASEELDRMIAEVLAQGPYDIIHINMGLHGIKDGHIPPDQFIPLTRKLVENLRRGAPHAQIIWASTTPVAPHESNGELDKASNETVQKHNRLAAQVMTLLNVPIDDLYAVASDHLDLQKPDGIHWGKEGGVVLGQAVAAVLEKALKEIPSDRK